MLLEEERADREVNPMIRFTQKGDFSKLNSFLQKSLRLSHSSVLDKYGKMGVEALRQATPVETGKTAASWYYTIESTASGFKITWSNNNFNKGVPIAIIIQYGHGTGTGGWVEGRDYINPALRPIFDQMSEELWKEATKV